MQFLKLSVALAAVASYGVSAQDALAANNANPVAKSFIIEYTSGSAKRRDGLFTRDDLKVVKSFDSSIFSGATVETETLNVDSLARLPNVARVWPNTPVQLDPITAELHADASDSGDYSTHVTTGVSKLHDMGYFGEGVKVGIVDTGVYYKHQALGGCFGDGCKVAGGYDFIGEVDWPVVPKSPDNDPTDVQGHGTHVAGIVAGSNGEGWMGVAPNASIYAYKVFGNLESTDSATLIESFLKAYEDGMDIITSSIGGPSGWSNNPWAEVASRIAREGVVVTISAGNSGSAGPFFGSSGSAGTDVVAVASIAAEKLPSTPFEATFDVDGSQNTTTLGYLPATNYFPAAVQDWPVVVLNPDTSDPADGCEPYPEDTPRIEEAIPLVRRGSCTFAQKQANLEALGAKYILIYNNESPITTPSTDRTSSLIGMITAGTGELLIGAVEDGGKVTLDFSVNPEQPYGLEYPSGGRPSDFTSWAGLYDLQLKPDVGAPGGNIFSTYPGGGYAVLSGTSMACPYVAGVAALYIGVHGGRKEHGKDFAKMLQNRIISSGVAVPWYDTAVPEDALIAPVAQVGTGLIDAFKVVTYSSSVDFAPIALNDTHFFSRYHDVTVRNDDDESVSYKFSMQPGAGVEAAGWFPLATGGGEYRIRSLAELQPTEFEPEISLPRDFTLKPGEKKTVSVNFDNPDKLGWNATALPLYSGKILVASSKGEQLSVPYYGLGANLKTEMKALYRTGYPKSTSTTKDTPIESKSSYSFDLSVDAQDFPKIVSKNVWGTRQVRWDIFEAGWRERNWKYPPVEGENGYIGSVASWVGSGQVDFFDPNVDDADETFTYPLTDLIRNAQTTSVQHDFWWFGKLGNGSQIEPGKYTMRFATLKPFGDPYAANNWAVYQTPQIEVTGKYKA
ncbi:subtilase [Emericellopsis atlantica]|uniref:Subtilase n=1 Tax=Emericellopsis atlantica TaxID=2614577 RepID=A0A9P7ZGU9_9HYPO|nr:subtilase [Emericellopsis atlantica]KAG9251869.1 subtilase [Emericellopsis atlantica]